MNKLSNSSLDPSLFPTEAKKDEVKDLQEIWNKLSEEKRKVISNLFATTFTQEAEINLFP